MRLSDFGPGKPGRLVRPTSDYWAFVPAPLAPRLSLGSDPAARLSRADRALGRLAGMAQTIRHGHLLADPFIRREAVHSCRLDRISCELATVFVAEAQPNGASPPGLDAALAHVSTYEAARALGRRADADRRFLRGLHRRIVGAADAPAVVPGEFRDRQCWIGPPGCSRGDAPFVPPPVPEMHEALADLERYSREPDDLPPLVRAALIHYQIDVIQPFLVGSGRVNRLLLTLMLMSPPELPAIPVGMSAYFRANAAEYRRVLAGVTLRGEWEAWLRFFLDGVARQAEETATRLVALLALHDDYRRRLQRAHQHKPVYWIVDRLFRRPAVGVSDVARRLAAPAAEVRSHLERLVELKVLEPARAVEGAYVAPALLCALDGEPPAVAELLDAMRLEDRRRTMPAGLTRPTLELTREDPLDDHGGIAFPQPLLDERGRRRVLALLREIEAASSTADSAPPRPSPEPMRLAASAGGR